MGGGGMRSMAGPRRRRRGAAPTNRRVAQMTLSLLVFDLVVYPQVAQLPTLTTTIATQDGGMHTTAGQLGSRLGAAPTNKRAAQMIRSSPAVVEELPIPVLVPAIPTITIATQGGGTPTMAGQSTRRRGVAPTSRRVAQVIRSTLVAEQFGLSLSSPIDL